MKAKKIIGKLLLAFLLVSVGVAIGKELASRNVGPSADTVIPAGQEKVLVYYMHGIPCVTCTFIETTAEKLVREEFAEAVESGRMEFLSVNYLEPENWDLADKYKVEQNMVIAVRFEDEKETGRVRLDGVMNLVAQPDKLKDYLRQGIRSALEGDRE